MYLDWFRKTYLTLPQRYTCRIASKIEVKFRAGVSTNWRWEGGKTLTNQSANCTRNTLSTLPKIFFSQSGLFTIILLKLKERASSCFLEHISYIPWAGDKNVYYAILIWISLDLRAQKLHRYARIDQNNNDVFIPCLRPNWQAYSAPRPSDDSWESWWHMFKK